MGRVGDVKKKILEKKLQDDYMDIFQEIDVIDVIIYISNLSIVAERYEPSGKLIWLSIDLLPDQLCSQSRTLPKPFRLI